MKEHRSLAIKDCKRNSFSDSTVIQICNCCMCSMQTDCCSFSFTDKHSAMLFDICTYSSVADWYLFWLNVNQVFIAWTCQHPVLALHQ